MRTRTNKITHLKYYGGITMKYYVIDGIRYSEEEYKMVFERETN